ncbi:hypothetical protein A0H81_04734 [Grifola frondosa]|uniref:Thioester reductase (TE) domain-containing protein n=1 Tax=Grifola frondosa TaxID=5627 RepID=A0A1C7MGC0_GRIFR|nr:hypothetical protein A0H81_04734 [Grifola frondosa]
MHPCVHAVCDLSVDVFVVMGTTGSLGSYILDRLVANTEIMWVYALNRAVVDGSILVERQRTALTG